ncbi:polysaccharide pyruvyl transferase family protein [Desulfocastanea catecholica]
MTTHRKKYISLLGVTHNTDNYGVRVLMSSAVEILLSLAPNSDITVLDYGRNSEQWAENINGKKYLIKLNNLRFSWRLYLPNNVFRLVALAIILHAIPSKKLRHRLMERNFWLKEIIQTSSCYAISGGDSFSDIYGFRRLLYVALPQILVLLLDKPLVLLPQTYGPFKSRVSQYIARWILRRAKAVYSRDQEGVGNVRTLTGADGPNVKVVPDVGFIMSCEPIPAETLNQIEILRHRRPIVGVNVSKLLYMGGYHENNMFQLRHSFPELIENIINYTIHQMNAQVLLIPHVCGGPNSHEDETLLCKKLLRQLQSHHGEHINYLDQYFNHRQMKTVIGRCDLFVGARMHACIGAVSQGVPTVCLAYSEKFKGVMKPLGRGAQVIDLRIASPIEVQEAISSMFHNRNKLRLELNELIPNLNKSLRLWTNQDCKLV